MTGCGEPIDRETKKITITIVNDNEDPITKVSIWTIRETGRAYVMELGSDMHEGEPVEEVPHGETYTSPLVTVRTDDEDLWWLGVNVNNIDYKEFPNLLNKEIPPDTVELKFTTDKEVLRK